MKRAAKIATESLLLPFSADDESQDGRSKGRAVPCGRCVARQYSAS